MKKLFEFKCQECSNVFEEYTEYKKESHCPLCNSLADKIISAPRVSLEGITGAFPSASWAWEQKHTLPTNKETE